MSLKDEKHYFVVNDQHFTAHSLKLYLNFFYSLRMSQNQKTGPELAEQRVKRRQRQARKEIESLKQAKITNQVAYIDSTLIGELKAAQSNNRNEKLREKVSVQICSFFTWL